MVDVVFDEGEVNRISDEFRSLFGPGTAAATPELIANAILNVVAGYNMKSLTTSIQETGLLRTGIAANDERFTPSL